MIRVLIKASSPAVRAGLRSMIRAYASFQVIGDTPDEPDASVDDFLESQPDVILAELESHHDESTSEMLEMAADGMPAILLVRSPTSEWADALKQGVRAVLPNNANGPQIAAAIEAVFAGLAVFNPADLESIFEPQRSIEIPETLPEALTPREIEVLRSMAEGHGNKEIASRLGISEHTVKFHVASIMGKLGAGSRTEAVMLGIRHGIVLI